MATPYAPPAAPVSDPVVQALPRPRTVLIASVCIWLSIVVALVAAVSDVIDVLQRIRSGADSLMTGAAPLVPTAIMIAILALIAAALSAGRGWVRWLYVVIYGMGALSLVALTVYMPKTLGDMTGLMLAATVFNWTIQTVALILMFVKPSREWFTSLRLSR